jgi:hypothetical protein
VPADRLEGEVESISDSGVRTPLLIDGLFAVDAVPGEE